MSVDKPIPSSRSQNDDSTPYLSVAAPVYNEEDLIREVVLYWSECLDRMELNGELVLCNDGSTDRTGAILAGLQDEVPCLNVVGGEENHGYGAALSTAIASCKGKYIATIDSDGQFDLMDIQGFVAEMEKADLDGVMGRRVAKQDSVARVLADRGLNMIVRFLFGTRLRDTNCALKLVRRDLLQKLRLEATGFSFPTEVCVRLEYEGANLAEAPVRHLPRAAGESKLNVWRVGWRMLWFLVYMRVQLTLRRRTIIRAPY